MLPLLVRHTKLFFKDKASVFFSVLSVLIIILLYILFLAETISANLTDLDEGESFTFLWMFAGVLAVTSATTPLGALGKFIEDKVSKRDEDLLMAPIKRSTLIYSYIGYAFFIGCILTTLLFIFGYIYAYFSLGVKIDLSFFLMGVLFFSLLMHTLLFYLIVAQLPTMASFNGLSTIVGTLIGFLAGIYVPIGFLPAYIQKIIIAFPTTQAAVLLRNSFLDEILLSFQEVLPEDVYQALLSDLGVELYWNETFLSSNFSWLYIFGLSACLILIILFSNHITLTHKGQ